MVVSEKVAERYRSAGFDVLDKGFPSLILLKDDQVQFVRVKEPDQPLTKVEEESLRLLSEHGFCVVIEFASAEKGRKAADSSIPRHFDTLDEKGRLLIPKKLREQLGVRLKQSLLQIEEYKGKLLISVIEK